ncbi:MAG: hypothetical protein GX621_13995 [Pirellulaceae bacterium]|nr:hypothetical protein [Pirellulaceae bacterium]
MGDFNSDRVINAADASILAAHWSDHAAEAMVVPEPSVFAMLIVIGLGVLTPRGR